MKKATKFLFGFLIGLINSLLGACGGILSVAALKKEGLEQREAHANAVAIILPITIISSCYYLLNDYVEFNQTLIYLPGGFLGAVAGGFLLPRIPQKILKRVFAVLVIWAGIRMIIR
ncbi:MAG: sulfite exporter TauE/SafE family protein [Clostridia bacterium]|nr:sulfite exporter TauE/SafE family protein [Clostridia bacterium]